MDPSAPSAQPPASALTTPAQPPASALTTPAQVGGTPVLGAAWGPGPSPGGMVQTTHAPRSYLAPNSLNGAYQQRWGSSLTPLALTAAIKSADLGTMFPLADLLDEVRETDPHVQATLAKREWVVAGAEWEVRPSRAYEAGQEPDVAREARELCASVLRALPALPDRFADLMGAVYYGRAVVEVVWERQGGYLIPSRLYPVHPRMIQYDAGWNLRLWSNMPPFPFGAYPGIAVQDAVPGRFIVHTPRIRGGFYTREGLGRTLAWWAMFKRWVVRDAMGLAEMAGRLARLAQFQSGRKDAPGAQSSRTPDEDVQYIVNLLNNWNASVGLVYPDDIDVKLLPPVTGNTIHTPLVEMFNAEMSKCVLGGTLTMESGSRGARSLGDVHADEARMIARYDANSLSETLRSALLAPLVKYNFGPHVPVPEIRFVVDPQESQDALADRVVKLVKAGLSVGEGWVRNQFGIPDPVAGEALMGASVERKLPSVADNATGEPRADGSPAPPSAAPVTIVDAADADDYAGTAPAHDAGYAPGVPGNPRTPGTPTPPGVTTDGIVPTDTGALADAAERVAEAAVAPTPPAAQTPSGGDGVDGIGLADPDADPVPVTDPLDGQTQTDPLGARGAPVRARSAPEAPVPPSESHAPPQAPATRPPPRRFYG